MYAEHFQLERVPFANTADPAFYFRTAGHEETLAALLYGVTQRRGITVVTGEAGMGKTLLARMLVASLAGRADVAAVDHIPADGHELLCAVLRALEIRHRPAQSDGELLERLKAHLRAQLLLDRFVVVLLDDAQDMSPAMLEYVRMLGDLEQEASKLVQVVLLGRPGLLQTLQRPEMTPLRQRIADFCRLTPMEHDQTRNYIRHRLTVAGAKDASIINDEAVDLIHDRSGGIPRLINQIADGALLAAYGRGLAEVDRDCVVSALQDLLEGPETAAPGPAADTGPAGHPAAPLLIGQSAPSVDPRLIAGAPSHPVDAHALWATQHLQGQAQMAERVIERAAAQCRDLENVVRQGTTLQADLQGTLRNLRDECRESRPAAQALADRIEELRELIRQADRQKATLQEAAVGSAAAGERYARLRRRARLIAAQCAEDIGRLARRLAEAAEQEQALQQATLASELARTRLGEETASLEQRGGALAGLTAQVAGQLEDLNRGCRTAQDLLVRLAAGSGKLEALLDPARFRDIQEQAASLEALLNETHAACTAARAAAEEALSARASLLEASRTVQELRAGVEDASIRADRQVENLSALNERCASRQEALEKLLAASEESLGRLAHANTVLAEASKAVDALGEASASGRQVAQQVRQATGDAREAVDRLLSGIHLSECRQAGLQELINRAEVREKDLDTGVSRAETLKAELAEWIGRAEAAGQSSAQLAARLETAAGRCDDLTRQADERAARLEAGIGQAAQTLDTLQTRAAAALAQALRAEKAAEAARTGAESVSELEQRLLQTHDDLGNRLSQAQQQVAGLIDQARAATAAGQSAASQAGELLETLTAQVAEGRRLADQLAGLEGNLGAAAADLLAAQRAAVEEAARLDSIADRVERTAEDAAGRVERQVAESRTRIDELLKAVNAAGGRIAAQVSAAHRAMADRATQLATLLEQAKADAAALSTQLSGAEDRIAQLQTLDRHISGMLASEALDALKQRQERMADLFERTSQQHQALARTLDEAAAVRKEITAAAAESNGIREILSAAQADARSGQKSILDAVARAAAVVDRMDAGFGQARELVLRLQQTVRSAQLAESETAARAAELAARVSESKVQAGDTAAMLERASRLCAELEARTRQIDSAREVTRAQAAELAQQRALAESACRRLEELLSQAATAGVVLPPSASPDRPLSGRLTGKATRSVEALAALRETLLRHQRARAETVAIGPPEPANNPAP